jgi:hypothetical protein
VICEFVFGVALSYWKEEYQSSSLGGGGLKKIFSKLLRSGVLKVKKMTVLAMAW